MQTLVIEALVLIIGIGFLSIIPMTFLVMYGSITLLSITVLIIARHRNISFAELGFTTITKKSLLSWVIMTLGLLLLLFALNFFYPDGVFTGLLKERNGYIYFIPLYSLGVFLQEFVFRGYYFARVKKHMSMRSAVVLNIVIFSLSHLPVFFHLSSSLFFLSMVGGIFWSIYYSNYPNIYLAWLSHNLIGLAAFLLLQTF